MYIRMYVHVCGMHMSVKWVNQSNEFLGIPCMCAMSVDGAPL